jgi:hypothetical protein
MDAKALCARYEKAKSKRENFVPLFEECYEYTLPQRESFYATAAGERRDDKIFDETAVVGIQEFASRLQAGMVPNFARWADLVAGSEVPKDQREAINNDLDEVTDFVFEAIHNSNFGSETHESFLDLAVGTGTLACEEGDSVNPIVFSAIPLPQMVIESGPDGRVDGQYRERREIRFSDIEFMYEDATLDQRIVQNAKTDKTTTIIEMVLRDRTSRNEEVYNFYAIENSTKTIVYQEEMRGVGSNPFIVFRWGKAAGEDYGRGPIVNALSAIKTTNLTIELVLENAQMSISGIYQMEDDGVTNVDTIQLVPGTIIPKAQGSRGLEAVQAAGRFDVAQLVLNDMRHNIKMALYNEMLGDPNRTPASATEIAERMADLSRRIGSAFGRLQYEFVNPVLQRVVYILRKRGLIELPTVNGREVKIRPISPLAQAQANEDITSVARWLELVGGSFGPEMLNILIDSVETSVYLGKKYGVPDTLIRDEEQRKQLMQMAQEMAQQQAQQAAAPEGQQIEQPQ